MSRVAPAQGWAGSALGRCLRWHGSPPKTPALPAQPCHPQSPVLSLSSQTSPCCHRTAPRSRTRSPTSQGAPVCPPALPDHHNADMFAQHPPSAHPGARKGVKSPGPGTALHSVGGTHSPPNTALSRALTAATHAVAPVLGTLCPGWPQGGSGHLCPQDCPAELGCQQGSTPGWGHCRDPHGPSGAGRLPWGGRGAVVPMGRGLLSPWMRGSGPRGRGTVVPISEGPWSL